MPYLELNRGQVVCEVLGPVDHDCPCGIQHVKVRTFGPNGGTFDVPAHYVKGEA